MTMNPPVRCTDRTPTSASTATGMRSRCRNVEVIKSKRRDRDPVGRQVGHRGDAELDVGHRGERRRQCRRGGRDPGGAPLRWSRGRSRCQVSMAALVGNSQTEAATELSV